MESCEGKVRDWWEADERPRCADDYADVSVIGVRSRAHVYGSINDVFNEGRTSDYCCPGVGDR